MPISIEILCKGLSVTERREWAEFARVAARRIDGEDEPVAETGADGPVIYFVSAWDAEIVKIGFTTSMRSRLRSLRTACPKAPRIHLLLKGTLLEERELHKRFEADRIRGEWFRLSAAIRAFIDKYKTDPP